MRFILCFLIGFIIFILLNNIDTYTMEYPSNSIYTINQHLVPEMYGWPIDTGSKYPQMPTSSDDDHDESQPKDRPTGHGGEMFPIELHTQSRLGYYNKETSQPEKRRMNPSFYKDGCWKYDLDDDSLDWIVDPVECMKYHDPEELKNGCSLDGWITNKDGSHLPKNCDKTTTQLTFNDNTSHDEVQNTGFNAATAFNKEIQSELSDGSVYMLFQNNMDPRDVLPAIKVYDAGSSFGEPVHRSLKYWTAYDGAPSSVHLPKRFPHVSVVITDFESVIDMYAYILYVKNNEPEFSDIPDPILLTDPHGEMADEISKISEKSLPTESRKAPGGGYVKLHNTTVDNAQITNQDGNAPEGCSFTVFEQTNCRKGPREGVPPGHFEEPQPEDFDEPQPEDFEEPQPSCFERVTRDDINTKSSDTFYLEDPVVQSNERNWKDPTHDFMTTYTDDRFMTIAMRTSDGENITSYGIPHRHVTDNASNCQINCSIPNSIDNESVKMYKFMRRLGLVSVDSRDPNSEKFVILWGYFGHTNYMENYRTRSDWQPTHLGTKTPGRAIERPPRLATCSLLYDTIYQTIQLRYYTMLELSVRQSPQLPKLILYCLSCSDAKTKNSISIPAGHLYLIRKVKSMIDHFINPVGDAIPLATTSQRVRDGGCAASTRT